MHFLTLFYVSVLTLVSADYEIVILVSASVSADMKIRYIGGYQVLKQSEYLVHTYYLNIKMKKCLLQHLYEEIGISSTYKIRDISFIIAGRYACILTYVCSCTLYLFTSEVGTFSILLLCYIHSSFFFVYSISNIRYTYFGYFSSF